ncbi:MAG: hypothetical protein K8W52_08845 [Deltaproteobacteria bacterium]|nr:hypothetical protein [Deltaproteobacteria bacterium]
MPPRLIAAVALAALGACATVANEDAPDAVATLSEPVFRCKVEPILVRDCSYTGCHGIRSAALRVFSPGKLRRDPAPTLDDRIKTMTDAEHHDNYLSAAGFTFGGVAPDDNWLVRKPLPVNAGGYGHKGGAIFSGTDDPRVVAIKGWLAGTGSCP